MDATTTSIDDIEVIQVIPTRSPIKPEQTVNTATNELVKTFPFLDDRNVQDFLFAGALIIQAPYTATTGVQKAWEIRRNALQNK
jgi:hypothetical protein